MNQIGMLFLGAAILGIWLTGWRYTWPQPLSYHEKLRAHLGDQAVVQGMRGLQSWVDLATIAAVASMTLVRIRLGLDTLFYMDVTILMGLVVTQTAYLRRALAAAHGVLPDGELANHGRIALGRSFLLFATVVGFDFFPMAATEHWAWIGIALLGGSILFHMSYGAYRVEQALAGKVETPWRIGVLTLAVLVVGLMLTG